MLPQSQNDSPKQTSLTAHTSKLMRKNKERQREVAQVVFSLSIFSEEKQVAPLSTPLKIKKSFHSEEHSMIASMSVSTPIAVVSDKENTKEEKPQEISSSIMSFYAPKFNFYEELTAKMEETKKSNFVINFSRLTGTYTEPLMSFECDANIIMSDDDSEIKNISSNEDASIFLGDFPNDSTFNIDINTPKDEILIDGLPC